MIVPSVRFRVAARALVGVVIVACAAPLSGCASMGEGMSSAFADPSKYNLYDCKQLAPERKRLATALAENQGLMAKAETGVGGSVVSELAYRNENIALHGQLHFAEEAWRKNRCRESPPAASTSPPAKPLPPPSRAGSAVY